MLRFFRSLRRKLIEENNLRKYIWYALGEIMLVVIGIMIAVQVNAAIENSRDEYRRVQLVNGLTSEFKSNLSQLETVIFYQNQVLDSGNDLIREIAKRNDVINQTRIDTLLSDNSWTWTYDPLNGVLNSGISSSDIQLIENDSLKILLFSWEHVVQDAHEEQFRALIHYQDQIQPYLANNASISNIIFLYRDRITETSFEHDYRNMLFDPVFENLFSLRSIHTLDVLAELEGLHELNIQILELLEKEK